MRPGARKGAQAAPRPVAVKVAVAVVVSLVVAVAVAAPVLLPETASAAGVPRTQPAYGTTALAAPSREDTGCRGAPERGVKLPESLPGRQLSERLGLAQAWDLADGAGVKVGVVDSGVDHRHPGLRGSVDTGSEPVSYTHLRAHET